MIIHSMHRCQLRPGALQACNQILLEGSCNIYYARRCHNVLVHNVKSPGLHVRRSICNHRDVGGMTITSW